MKKVTRICVWGGGVSTLILALIASICLAVVPQNLTNEYGNNDGVMRAATEIIDGHEYAVLEVDNKTSSTAVDSFMGTSNYLKFILKENLVCNQEDSNTDYLGPTTIWRHSGLGRDIVLDFNGHTITLQSPIVGFEILAGHLRIYDSSAAGTGGVKGNFGVYNRNGVDLQVEIYGGTFDHFYLYDSIGSTSPTTQLICQVYGGVVQQFSALDVDTGMDLRANVQLAVYGGRVGQVQPGIAVPAYLHTTYDVHGNVTAAMPYDAYAVSPSTLYAGTYNYAYGYQWELSAVELSKLAIPADQTYYLWGRTDGRYQYLGLCSGEQTAHNRVAGNLMMWDRHIGTGVNITAAGNNFTGGKFRNTVTFDCKGGWEVMYLPVAVPRQADCVLSTYVEAPDFEPYAVTNCQGLFLGVLTELPKVGNKHQVNQPNAILAGTEIAPQTKGDVELTFNSGDHDVVYLVINGGYLNDDQVLSFVFNNLQLTMNYRGWPAA